MTILILFVVSTFFLALAAVALTLRKVASPKRAHPVSAEWIEELSIERYRPMLRLLDTDDHEFVRSQSSFEETKFAEFRRDRCRLFRTYLKWLNADFASVCLALKVIMLQADVDRPDLASTLLRSQIRFAIGMLTVQLQLALYEAGFGAVDVRGLLTLFDSMRLELRSLAPESAVWGS